MPDGCDASQQRPGGLAATTRPELATTNAGIAMCWIAATSAGSAGPRW
jgi:hypothetical protein